ncbi:DCC family protein At1g52590 chloroplastic [Euphorbia peplus]|nr:DCC family protein At1g52590 chloroplastic [Euphorbia peplus]
MALLTPIPGGGCVRFPTPVAARRMSALATVSPPSKKSSRAYPERVDIVEATNSFFHTDSRPIMLFDGVCNLCNGGVRFVRDNDPNRRIRYEALQSEAGRKLLQRSGRAPDDISSVVLVEKERSYIKSDAVLRIMEYITLPFPQLAFFLQFVPLFIRDFAYDNVANNRYTIFGRSESCEIYYD